MILTICLTLSQEHRLCAYPAMEIYHRDTIYYVLPLSQQGQFLSLFETDSTNSDGGDQSSDENTEIDEDVSDESSTDDANKSTSSFEEL